MCNATQTKTQNKMKKIKDSFKNTDGQINYEFMICFVSTLIVWTLLIINRI